jgi:hypothetical protein
MDPRTLGGSRDAWQLAGFHQQGDPAFLPICFVGRLSIASLLEKYR